MNEQQVMGIGAMLALVGSLGPGVVFTASDRQSSGTGDPPSTFGGASNQGDGFSDDQSIKGKDRNPESNVTPGCIDHLGWRATCRRRRGPQRPRR